MKLLISGAVAALTLMAALPAAAADWTVIRHEVPVARPAAAAWAKIGTDYCAIGGWMKTTCTYTAGSGDVGTVRQIAGRVNEVLVAKTPSSYTYADVDPKLLYHGTLAVEPVNAKSSKIVYTLVYNAEPVGDAAARATDRERRSAMFKRVAEGLKVLAEAP
jgi:hypothetical protein